MVVIFRVFFVKNLLFLFDVLHLLDTASAFVTIAMFIFVIG